MTCKCKDDELFGLSGYSDPGHPIPYHFTAAEIDDFMARHSSDAALNAYRASVTNGFPDPPWGMIVQEDYGEILVWYDAARVLHVVDVTNLSIAAQVKAAPFVSPNSPDGVTLFDDLKAQFATLFGGIVTVMELALGLAAVYFVFQAVRR